MTPDATLSEAPEATNALRVLIPSPLGSLGIAFREQRVVSLLIQPSPSKRRAFSPLAEADRSDFLDEALGRLSEYFAGARRDPRIDVDLEPSGLVGFPRRVLSETTRIPYGSTWSYQQLAAAAGEPAAYRWVRSILVSNPIPILIPCHRVVTQKGSPGSYIGGEKKKTWLLKLESRGVSTL